MVKTFVFLYNFEQMTKVKSAYVDGILGFVQNVSEELSLKSGFYLAEIVQLKSLKVPGSLKLAFRGGHAHVETKTF